MRSMLMFAFALAALSAAPSARADEPNPADVAVAREHFKAGAKLAEEGKWAEAVVRYEKSLEIKRAPITLYSLGIANKELGRYVIAIESLRAFLAEPLVDATKPYEKPAREAIAELELKLGYVVVRVSGAPDARVSIDGVELPAASVGERRPVDPGKHAVVARAPGYAEASRELDVASGQQLEVELALAPIEQPKDPAPSPTPPAVVAPPKSATAPPLVAAPQQAGPARAIQWALVGGGGGLFAIGLGVGVAGIVEASGAPSSDGEDASRALDLALAGDVVGGVGLAALGAGAIWLIVDAVRGEPEPRAPVRVTARGFELTF